MINSLIQNKENLLENKGKKRKNKKLRMKFFFFFLSLQMSHYESTNNRPFIFIFENICKMMDIHSLQAYNFLFFFSNIIKMIPICVRLSGWLVVFNLNLLKMSELQTVADLRLKYLRRHTILLIDVVACVEEYLLNLLLLLFSSLYLTTNRIEFEQISNLTFWRTSSMTTIVASTNQPQYTDWSVYKMNWYMACMGTWIYKCNIFLLFFLNYLQCWQESLHIEMKK